MNSLSTAHVIGFFSLPSLTIAEHNPDAYNAAMAAAPAGAGSCSHCGTGILHHVVIRDEASRVRFVGSDCAVKVGVPVDAVKYRMTSDQIAARDAKRAQEIATWQHIQQDKEDARAAIVAARRELVGDLVDMLRNEETDFHSSLADQLEIRPLSYYQAGFVAKATSPTGRRNKKNGEAWDAIIERCCLQCCTK